MESPTNAAHDSTAETSGAATEAWASPAGVADPADPRRRRRIASAVALAAVLLGLAGDLLLNTDGLGINLVLWTACAVAAFAVLGRRRAEGERAWQWALTIPLLFFAGVFVWRAAGQLLALNMLALLSAFGVLALGFIGQPRDVRRATVGDYIGGFFGIGLSGAVGAIPLLAVDGALRETSIHARRGVLMPVMRGLVIALPILLIFGGLLSSADARFERLMRVVFDIDVEAAIQHIVFGAFIAWVAAGYLRGALVANRPLGIASFSLNSQRPSLGIVELSVPLALLNVLFAVFVALQLPYLFGGTAHLQRVAGLTMADYARRGFFELVTVAALLLPLLLAGSALVRRADPRHERTFRWLTTVTLGLLAIMMFSALQRMYLYTQSFGLTSDRIHATAAMLWLGVVFALFSVTALRGRHAGFAFGSVLAAWVTIATLDIVNPDALIVRTNVERAASGAPLDAAYVSSLSTDAVPELVAALPRVDAPTRCLIAKRLMADAQRRKTGVPADWRWWNASRTRAYRMAHDVERDTPAGECASATTAR